MIRKPLQRLERYLMCMGTTDTTGTVFSFKSDDDEKKQMKMMLKGIDPQIMSELGNHVYAILSENPACYVCRTCKEKKDNKSSCKLFN